MRPFTCIVIGGGVIGLSTAYFLARRSGGRIIVLEKGCVGDGASTSRRPGVSRLPGRMSPDRLSRTAG